MIFCRRELYWLTRHYKGWPVPPVYLDDTPGDLGCYWCPGLTKGVLPVNPVGSIVLGREIHDSSYSVAGTLAHEYRHHIQWWSLGLWELGKCWETPNYERCPFERDAFAMERTVAQDAATEYWAGRMSIPRLGRSEALDLMPKKVATFFRLGVDKASGRG